MDAFCRQFCSGQLDLPETLRPDVGDNFYATVFASVGDADRSFRDVELDAFAREVVALRLELFGLALTHQLGWQRASHSLQELSVTRDFLFERGEERLWSIMGDYNRAIADAAMRTTHRRIDRGRLLISLRLELFERWPASLVPQECVARYANRYDTLRCWLQGQALIHLMRMQSMVSLFSDEAVQRVSNVRFRQPSLVPIS